MSSVRPRVEYLLVRYGRGLAALLVVVGVLVAGWGAWVYAHPPTTQITEETDERTVQTTLGTSAVVTGESSLYREGTVLRNRSVYLLPDTPVVTLGLHTGLAGEGKIRVAQRVALRYRAVRDGEAFWSRTRTLAAQQTTTRGSASLKARVNATHVRRTLAEKQEAVGTAGSVSAALVFRVTYETGPYSGTLRFRIPLEPDRGWYTMPPTTRGKSHSQSVTRTETLPRSSASYLVPGAAGGVAVLAGLAALFVTRRREIDPEASRHLMHERQYAEWVSPGRLPDLEDVRRVEMSSLPALVDVAVDADRRVVHDETTGRYAVLDGETAYLYDPGVRAATPDESSPENPFDD